MMSRSVRIVGLALAALLVGGIAVVGWDARADQRNLRERLVADYVAGLNRSAGPAPSVAPTDAVDGGGALGGSGGPVGFGSVGEPSSSTSGSAGDGKTVGGSALDDIPTSVPKAPISFEEVDVRLLTPLLDMARFGSTAGFLLACNTAGGTISQGAAEFPGTEQVVAELVGQLSIACAQFSEVAEENLDQLAVAMADLAATNPLSEAFYEALVPFFDALDSLAPHLDPLGDVIAGLRPIIAFFIGPLA